jgi:hypothetical protein
MCPSIKCGGLDFHLSLETASLQHQHRFASTVIDHDRMTTGFSDGFLSNPDVDAGS